MRFLPAFRRVCPPVVLFLAGFIFPMQAQSFLNGNLELNLIDSCGINLQNVKFNENVPFVTAFGDKNEVDLLSETCVGQTAAEGSFFVALNTVEGQTDALAFELKESLVSGLAYQFAFSMMTGDEAFAQVEIGLSESPTEFGDLIYSSEAPGFSWDKIRVAYFAPNNGRYITARLNSAYPAWVFLDAFELVCPSQFSLGRDTTLCSVDGYPLSVSVAYDEYEWQNGATTASITAEEPGWYWVEANSTFCSFRDSIYLQEFDYSCDCAIYQANAFSPNFDGINDQFRLPSACTYSDYFLQVSDRWGNIVFW
ncbi:MAG: gliding motility-associated C-terminal domain-containing protein, partial [Bacteroidota bacterium]